MTLTLEQSRVMTDRELDALIAEKVMGWEKIPATTGFRWKLPNGVELVNGEHWPDRFSTDRNAAHEVLKRIGEQKLVQEFEAAFEETYMQELMQDHGPRWLGQFGRMLASPRILMQAALIAVGAK